MREFTFLLIIISFASCTYTAIDETNNHGQLLVSDSLEQVNKYIWREKKTNFYLYRSDIEIVDDERVFTDKPRFEYLMNEEGSKLKIFDSISFQDMGTFWIDKYNFFSVYDIYGSRTVQYTSTVNFEDVCYYSNSNYKIKNGELIYFGTKWRTDSVLNCEILPSKVKKIKAFSVLNLDNSFEAYAMLNEVLLFHGCAIELSSLGVDLQASIRRAIKNADYETKICY